MEAVEMEDMSNLALNTHILEAIPKRLPIFKPTGRVLIALPVTPIWTLYAPFLAGGLESHAER